MSITGESSTDSQENVDAANEAIAEAEGITVPTDKGENEETKESETLEKNTEDEAEDEETEGDDDSEESDDDTEESEEGEEGDDDEDSEEDDDAETEDEDEAKEQDEGKKGRRNNRNRKQRRLVQKLGQKDAEIAYWRGRAEGRGDDQGAKGQQRETEQKVEEKPKPNIDDFDTVEEYTDALTDWKLDQRDRKNAEKQQVSDAQQRHSEVVLDHQKRAQEFAKTKDDFVEVVQDLAETGFEPSVAVEEAIYSSEIGPEVFYELAKKPKLFNRINKMSPIQAAKEIGKVEARLMKSETPSKKVGKKKTKISKAPAPLTKTNSKSPGKSTKTSSDNLDDFAEWERNREAELARRNA